MDKFERLRALEKAVELVSKATPGPWRFYEEQLRPNYPVRVMEVQQSNGAAVIPWAGFDSADQTKTTKRANAKAIIAAVNFIREHGSALIAELGQEVGAVAVPLTDDEHEWLMYAVDHMLDDSEPEDKACARVLQGLLDRCVVTSIAQPPHPLGERHAAIERALKGQTLLLMSRDHVNDQKKPLAEIKFGMSTDLGVLFCLADTEAPMPVDTSPAHTSEARDAELLTYKEIVRRLASTREGCLALAKVVHRELDFIDKCITDAIARCESDAAMRQEGGE